MLSLEACGSDPDQSPERGARRDRRWRPSTYSISDNSRYALTSKYTAECLAVYHIYFYRFHDNETDEISAEQEGILSRPDRLNMIHAVFSKRTGDQYAALTERVWDSEGWKYGLHDGRSGSRTSRGLRCYARRIADRRRGFKWQQNQTLR